MTGSARVPLCALAFLAALALTPSAGAAIPSYTKSSAASIAKKALRADSETSTITKKPRCKVSGRTFATCSAGWSDGLRRFTGKIRLHRLAPDESPVDTYKISGWGRAKYLNTVRYRRSGRIVVPTRRSTIGSPLRLLGISETSDLRVTPTAVAEPYIPNSEYDAPAAGKHLVRVDLTLTNVTQTNYSDSVNNSSTVMMSNGVTYDNDYVAECGGLIDIPYNESDYRCVVFAVPDGSSFRAFKFKLDSGFGQELGVWQ